MNKEDGKLAMKKYKLHKVICKVIFWGKMCFLICAVFFWALYICYNLYKLV